MTYAKIKRHVDREHLRCCGGFHPTATDNLPKTAQTVIILGNAGNQRSFDFWAHFEARSPGGENPLESWSRETLQRLAQTLNASPLLPFDGPPYIPIMTWAQRAEAVHPTPFGPLIHPKYGLWHAYRGVLLFDRLIDLPPRPELPSPCAACSNQPCRTTCPVAAISAGPFNVKACAEFLATAEGANCLTHGCQARRACPIGQDHVYVPAEAEFHLRAFAKTYGSK